MLALRLLERNTQALRAHGRGARVLGGVHIHASFAVFLHLVFTVLAIAYSGKLVTLPGRKGVGALFTVGHENDVLCVQSWNDVLPLGNDLGVLIKGPLGLGVHVLVNGFQQFL